MPLCPTCGERAETGIYANESKEFPAGPEIRVCHASDGAYLHVLGDD
jgi:hypothetical protein